PGEGDLFQARAADAGENARDGPAAAAPIEVAGRRIVEKRPDDQAVELAHIEGVPAAFEQMLTQTQALIGGIKIELVDLALVADALTRAAERGVARNRASHLQHQRAVAALDGIAPPLGRALADHVVEVQMGDDAAIGEEPGLLEDAGKRLGVGGLAAAHTNL